MLNTLSLIFGVILNSYLLATLLLRPSLWSTNNTFIGCILASNILYLNLQIIFDKDDDLTETQSNDTLNHFMEFRFHDTTRSVACSGQFLAQFIHERFVRYMLIGMAVLRSIMVKHANNIRTKNCKAHQARLSYIGILILIFVITNILAMLIIIFLSCNPVSGYVLVLYCRGIQATYDH